MSRGVKRTVLVALVAVVVLSLAAFAFDRYALSSTYARHPAQEPSLLPRYDLYEEAYPRTDVSFELDGYTLRGHVYGAENDKGLVVFHHGIFSKHQDYLPMITAMVDKGWRIFAYDAIGCGESDGDSSLGMSQSPIDVAAAVDFALGDDMSKVAGASGKGGQGKEDGRISGDGSGNRLPLVLWGHSWGGYGVAAALAQCPDVSACVTMSGFDTPMKVLDYSATSSFGPLGKMQWPFLWLNTVIDFGSAADVSASEAIVASGVPTLVIHGLGDTTVPYEQVSILGTLKSKNMGADAGDAGADDVIVLETMGVPGRDGHNNYFYSPESQAYLNQCAEDLQAMLDENGDDATAPEIQAYLEKVDFKKANTADPELIDEIDSFLDAALAG